MITDFKFAFRMLAKAPGLTAVAIITLALGIGANTAVFSALNALWLRSLPIKNPERLVSGYSMREGIDPYQTSLLQYAAYRERGHSFKSMGVGSQRDFNLLAHGEAQRLRGAAINLDYLTTLGTEAVAGRVFLAQEYQPDAGPVVILSHSLWQRLFGGDLGIIGRPLNFEDGVCTVVGIFPPGFNVPYGADIWVPLRANIAALPLEERAKKSYDLVARLQPGVSLAQADAELKGIARTLEREYPQLQQGWSYKLISLRQNLIGDLEGRTRKALFALVGAVAFVLLICCANLANLLLARGVARQREIGIRLALGASQARVVRQLLTEGLLLALFGGAAGLSLAYWIAPLLGRISPVQVVSLGSFVRDFGIDGHVLGFCFLLSLLTTVIFGFIPALRVVRSRDLITTLKAGGHRAGVAVPGRRLLDGLVIAEMAVAATLLVAGGLFVQSFQILQKIKLGFRPENLLMIEVPVSPQKYSAHEERVAFARQLLERVKALPGVVSAATTTNYPLQLYDAASSFTVESRPAPPPGSIPTTIHRLVSPEYLQTLGATLLKGRVLNEQDTAQSLPVAIVNEELARQAWPGEDPIGKRIRRGSFTETNFPWLTVVGLVQNIKEDRFNFRTDRPAWYLPYTQQETDAPLILIVRSTSDPASLTAAIRSALHSLDSTQPISAMTTMKWYLADVLVKERFSAILMGTLAGLGLILAAVGLYGVLAYSVNQRTGEIGLRMALGACSNDILRLILRHGLSLVGAGLVTGLLGAYAITRVLSATLYQISPTDRFTFTFAFVVVLLTIAALLACYLPARRAMKVDPMQALRYE